MTKRLIFTLLLSCSPLWATTYYVDNCVTVGNDLNNGMSPSAPWLTINKVNTSKFNPGDSILFESTCTWREQLVVPSSGAAGNPITIGAYGTGAAPVISGANLFTSWTPSAGSLYYASYSTAPNQVFEDGARLTQNTVSAASLTAGQWYLDTVNSRIWVYLTAGDNPSGHTMEASQRSSAIAVYEPYVTISGLQAQMANTSGINIEAGNVVITGVLDQSNYGWGIQIGDGSNVTVSFSTVVYNGGNGIFFYDSPSLLIEQNAVHDDSQLTNDAYSAGIGGSDAARGSTNFVIQMNTVYSNGVGQNGTQVGAGIKVDTVGAGGAIRYNRVYSNNFAGIILDAVNGETVYGNVVYSNGVGDFSAGWGCDGILALADADTTLTNTIVGNTVYGNYYGAIVIYGPSPEQAGGCANNIIENNIATSTVSGPNLIADNGCENPGTNGSGNVYTYNDFGSAASNFIEWGSGTYYSTYATWEGAAGNCGTAGCSYSVQAAPTFASASAGQFWLAGGSPGIGAGLNLGSPYNVGLMPGSTWPTGVTTGPTNTPPDIGAFVYVPAVAPPTNLQAVAH